ncbi:MAG: type III-B CRISPR module RAMP protein Cmr6 [Bacteroidota bacterium]
MNAGLHYYKHYYEEVDPRPEQHQSADNNTLRDGGPISQLQQQNEKLYEMTLNNSWSLVAGNSKKTLIDSLSSKEQARQLLCQIDLKTIYPGLVPGVGYMHEINLIDALKLGFSFDHTSGLPYIPGSSVKGLLRHASELNNGDYALSLVTIDRQSEVKPLLLRSDKKASAFVNHVFEGQIEDKVEGIYQRDIFLDAYPVISFNPEGKFLVNDYITPHITRDNRSLDAFTEPVPLQFLKVLPEVVFRFSFLLRGDKGGLYPQERLSLFKAMLLDLGIGAKTNVGYGQFAKLSDDDQQQLAEYVHAQERKIQRDKSRQEEQILKKKEVEAREKYKVKLPKHIPANTTYQGTVEEAAGDDCYISFQKTDWMLKKNRKTLKKKGIHLEKGMIVSIKVIDEYNENSEKDLVCTVKPLKL